MRKSRPNAFMRPRRRNNASARPPSAPGWNAPRAGSPSATPNPKRNPRHPGHKQIWRQPPHRPSGPAVPVRSAVNASSSLPNHTFKKEESSAPQQAPEPTHASQTPSREPPAHRKPVSSAPAPQTATASPKERKNAAHGTRHG